MHRNRCAPTQHYLSISAMFAGATILCVACLAPAAYASYSSKVSQTVKPPSSIAEHTPVVPTLLARLQVRLRLGDGKDTWHPTRSTLGIRYAPGGSDSSDSGKFRFVVDRLPLRNYLNAIAPYVRRNPKDARVYVTDQNASDDGSSQAPATISPGYDGARLDIDAAVDLIQHQIDNDPGVVHIILPLKTRSATVTAAKLTGIDARIGYFITRFNPGDEGRTATVRRAIDIIDGTVIAPGQIFSVDETVGPRDPAHGFFGKGHVFINGHMELQSGGGMCQVATTLFNAAMMADLKIVERHQHVRTVPYIDPGRDATIYHGAKDFKIQNNTAYPVYIAYHTSRSHAIVALFGKSVSGRKVRLINHYRQLGERHFTGVFYRIVSLSDGTKHRDPPFYSDYDWPPSLDFSR